MFYLFNGVRIWQRVCTPIQEEKIMAKASRHRRNSIVYQLMEAGGGERNRGGSDVYTVYHSNIESTIEEGTCRGQFVGAVSNLSPYL